MKTITAAGIVVYRTTHDNSIEFLLLRHPAGHWDFPKGRAEAGETKKETALRELQEETGISTTIIPGFEESFSYQIINPDGIVVNKTVTFFVGKAKSHDIILSDEHHDFVWLPDIDAIEQVTYQNAKELLSKVCKFLHDCPSVIIDFKNHNH